MAQTIAMQRGVVSCNTDTIVTLFTQSGGTSTRVIFNSVTWYFSQGTSNTYAMITYHNASGGSSVLGYYRNNSSASACQFMSTDNNALGFASGTSSAPINSSLGVNAGAGNYIGQVTGGITPVTPASTNQSFMPLNFWIGPSDSIKFTYSHSGGGTASVSYSFTTITES